jgi:endonuclease-3
VTRLHTALAKKFGERRPRKEKKKRDILDTVVGTILSQNTTNVNSARAFGQLRTAFKSWDAVRNAKPSAVEASIKCGGLAPKKTKWIQHVLNTLHAERGETSMEYLRKESKESVHAELERFPGIGKKTSAIINLFDVGHPDMAVDTHVFRYALQLGWVPTEAERAAHNKNKSLKSWPVVTRDSVYAHLDSRFPDRLKYSMHLILTDTVGGLPVICGASHELSFDGRKVKVDGSQL